MSSILIEGKEPLFGTVSISGAKNSVLKLIPAAMFSNEDTLLENVPRIQAVEDDLVVIRSLGGTAEWTGQNRLLLNGAELNKFEIPAKVGARLRTSLLFAGPLLFRFGKAKLPKYDVPRYKASPINRFLDTWRALGVEITEDHDYLYLNGESLHSGFITFKYPSHTATDNAILSSIFIGGETTITNASEESEIDDLIEMLNSMGAEITRPDPKVIKINGKNIFKKTKFKVQPDKSEIATFAAAAVLTKGNIIIKNVDKAVMIPFVNFLNKIDARFEFNEDELKVWRHDQPLRATTATVSPTPGFVPDWQSLATLLLTQAEGESYVHDTVYTDRFGYITDLNRMGAKIEQMRPTQNGVSPIISDDAYVMDTYGEPETLLKIQGPTKLRGERLNIQDFRYGAVHLLAALCAEGKSEISGIEYIEKYFEDITDKMINLGAKIWKQ